MAIKKIKISVSWEEEKTGVITSVRYRELETEKPLDKINAAMKTFEEEITGQPSML